MTAALAMFKDVWNISSFNSRALMKTDLSACVFVFTCLVCAA